MSSSQPQGAERVVVTGGAGFIGGAVCRRLLSAGSEVVIYDSFAGGERVRENARRLQALGARLEEGDIRDAARLGQVFRPGDAIIHLAAISSVPVCLADPELCRAVNEEGTETVLREAARAGARRLVFASTAAVYGQDPRLPSREEDPVAPASPYARSKLAGEAALRRAGISGVALRLFNVYGPGQDPKSSYSGVITRWVDGLRRRETLSLFGDGSQTRDFVHVEDVAAALHAALRVPEAPEGPVNIGSGAQTSLRQLLALLAEVLGVQAEVKRQPVRGGDVPHSCADISRARLLLGYRPEVGLRAGLRTLVDAEGAV